MSCPGSLSHRNACVLVDIPQPGSIFSAKFLQAMTLHKRLLVDLYTRFNTQLAGITRSRTGADRPHRQSCKPHVAMHLNPSSFSSAPPFHQPQMLNLLPDLPPSDALLFSAILQTVLVILQDLWEISLLRDMRVPARLTDTLSLVRITVLYSV